MTTREDPQAPWTLDTIPKEGLARISLVLMGADVIALRATVRTPSTRAQLNDLLRRVDQGLQQRAIVLAATPVTEYRPINIDHMGRVRQLLADGTVVERAGPDGVWRPFTGPLEGLDLTTYVYRYQHAVCPYTCNEVTLRELRRLVEHTGAEPFDVLPGVLSQLSNIVAGYVDERRARADAEQRLAEALRQGRERVDACEKAEHACASLRQHLAEAEKRAAETWANREELRVDRDAARQVAAAAEARATAAEAKLTELVGAAEGLKDVEADLQKAQTLLAGVIAGGYLDKATPSQLRAVADAARVWRRRVLQLLTEASRGDISRSHASELRAVLDEAATEAS